LSVTIAMDYCVLNFWCALRSIKNKVVQGKYFNPLVYLSIYKRVSLCLKKTK
jgi:hypothetical protein